jgi:predicted negative regulator of RcsB-dependent stress response
MPERAATLQELTIVRHLLEDLDRKLDRAVPREEFKRRLRRNLALVVVVVVVVVVAAVGWNRATLKQAQQQSERDIRTVLTTCRASVQLDQRQLAFCERRVPGFIAARAAARKNAAATQRNEARLEALERQVAKLQRR